ncbi:MAG TPA: hypothetical protein VM123_07505 [archaeon]|nr:hypothetical protein [archaeon]
MKKNHLGLPVILIVLTGSIGNATAASETAGKDNPWEKFTPELTGYFFYHHDGSAGDGKTNSFDFSRVYIGGRYKLSDKFTFRYISDIGHETGGGKFEVFTKYAYLDWKLNPKAEILLGLQATLNYKVPEKAWGYRVIRKAPMESFGDYWGSVKSVYSDNLEQRKLAALAAGNTELANKLSMQKSNFALSSKSGMRASADQGVTLSLKPTKKSYLDFMVSNGTGYKKAEDDKYKNFSVRGGGYFLDKALHLSAFLEVEPWEGKQTNGAIKSFTNFQWDLFASYGLTESYILGLNVNSKKFAGSYEDITAYCYSVFGNVSLIPQRLKALGRFDRYQTGFDDVVSAGPAGLKTNGDLYIIGLDYIPDKHVHFIPNLQVLSYENSNEDAGVAFYIHLLVEF